MIKGNTLDIDPAAAIVAAGAAVLGAVSGALASMFNAGRSRERIEQKIDAESEARRSANKNIDEKLTYICDELARRLTNLENRVQYDGYYIGPRIRRTGGDSPGI